MVTPAAGRRLDRGWTAGRADPSTGRIAGAAALIKRGYGHSLVTRTRSSVALLPHAHVPNPPHWPRSSSTTWTAGHVTACWRTSLDTPTRIQRFPGLSWREHEPCRPSQMSVRSRPPWPSTRKGKAVEIAGARRRRARPRAPAGLAKTSSTRDQDARYAGARTRSGLRPRAHAKTRRETCRLDETDDRVCRVGAVTMPSAGHPRDVLRASTPYRYAARQRIIRPGIEHPRYSMYEILLTAD